MNDLSDSIQKAFDILDCFSEEQPLLGISDLSRRLHLPKSTTQRLVNNLRHRRLLEQEPLSGKYRLGIGLFELGVRALRQMDLPRRAKPHLQTLTATTGETSTLAVLDGLEALYVERVESPRLLRASSIGSRMQLHCTAIGKVLLTGIGEAELERFLQVKGLPPRTGQTITDISVFRDCLAQVRQDRYAVDEGEFETGLTCIGAPVYDYASRIIASVGISAPTSRASGDNLQALVRAVCDAGHAISREMGLNGS